MRDPKIEKLSDEGGQYLVILKCDECNHTRRCYPHTLAAMGGGWEARLDDLVRRMRCSKCNAKKCIARTMRETAPRGYKSR